MKFNDNLFVTLEKEPKIKGLMIIHINGRIDAYNAGSFLKELKEHASKGYAQIIFDCSELQYLSSAGIASFTKLCDITSKKRGVVFLVNIPAKLVELIKLVNFAHLFKYAPDVEIARILIKQKLKRRKNRALEKRNKAENKDDKKP